MKTFITDKFLWDVYNFSCAGKDILNLFLRPYPTMYNSLPGPKNPVFKKYRKEMGVKNFSKLIYYLKTKGYIRMEGLRGKSAIMITKEGIGRTLKASFKLDRKRRKDGKWVMIAFDIPQRYKKSRNLLRSILYNLGYKMFQQSVWISPYDVSDKTEKLLQMHSLDKYVKIFLIEKI